MALASGSSWGGGAESAEPAQTPSSPAQTSFEQAKASIKKNDYAGAIQLLRQADKEDRNNPDILNLLAFSLRKTGKLDEALPLYARALKLRPQFPEAREYLGEAYIQAALQQVKILEGYGKEGEEPHEDLVAAFKKAAADLK